jgi:hypothetical protein
MAEGVKLFVGEVRPMLGLAGVWAGVTNAGVATATGSVAGNILTVTAVTGLLYPGNVIAGANISVPNTWIAEQLTGTAGGTGTYRLNNSMTATSAAITADGSGLWMYKQSVYTSLQGMVDGTAGTITAGIAFDYSNDALHPVATAAITALALSGTLTASDGATAVSAFKYIRARVTAIGGTGAVATASMSI